MKESMPKERSIGWLLGVALAGALLASCGGGESGAAAGGSAPPTPAGPGSATLSWTSPSQNIDGSAVANLAGYRIYHGTSANALNNVIQVNSPGITLYVVDNLATGKHYFAVSAYNQAGVESDRSEVASKSIN